MRGAIDVVTSDDRVVGRVADVRDGFLIVESGRLRKSRHPMPREFVHAVDEAAKVVVTVPRRMLMDAPRVDGRGNLRPGFGGRALRPRRVLAPASDRVRRRVARARFGLGSGSGFDPAPAGAETRKHRGRGTQAHTRGPPALLGDRRIDSRRLRKD